MLDHIAKYASKLERDRAAEAGSVRFYVLDDRVISNAADEWLPVFTTVFGGLNATALLFARPALPFADFLVRRLPPGADRLVPRDSETKTFFHDIPVIRKEQWPGRGASGCAGLLADRLRERKAVIIEDAGVVALGGVTVEQAYNAYSTIVHTTFIKYLLDLLAEGFLLPGEEEFLERFRTGWLRPVDARGLAFAPGPLESRGNRDAVLHELWRVGRYTVEKGLVDSFFGNISYFDGSTIHISQTAASLDDLEGHIDPVPLDSSSTAGLSASSELPAHKAIYLSTDYHAVLHGHPKFSVILSMHCTEKDCGEGDCGKNCTRPRRVCGVPIVSGEIGAGGLARTAPPAVREAGACIVYGHGVFSAGKRDFREAFQRMTDVENCCREEYFRLLGQK